MLIVPAVVDELLKYAWPVVVKLVAEALASVVWPVTVRVDTVVVARVEVPVTAKNPVVVELRAVKAEMNPLVKLSPVPEIAVDEALAKYVWPVTVREEAVALASVVLAPTLRVWARVSPPVDEALAK